MVDSRLLKKNKNISVKEKNKEKLKSLRKSFTNLELRPKLEIN